MKARASLAIACLSLVALLCGSLLKASPVQANPELYLPQGTPIEVQPSLSLSGAAGAMSKGAALTFTVKKDVVIRGWIVIPKGALVRGIVTTNIGNETATPAAAPEAATATPNMLGTAMTALNNATFSFEWLQLPAGKVRLDNQPQSVETALIGIGASVFSSASSLLGIMKGQSSPGNAGPDLSVHSLLEAHIAHDVHVPAISQEPEPASENSGFIDR